jgi:hypothetical protein
MDVSEAPMHRKANWQRELQEGIQVLLPEDRPTNKMELGLYLEAFSERLGHPIPLEDACKELKGCLDFLGH